MSTVLALSNGSSATYLNTELGTILLGLEASNNSGIEQSGVAFRRLSANRILLHDVSSVLGRKLFEMFTVVWDNTEAFELKWNSSNIDYSTQNAVNAAGFSGTTVTTLANIHAATYFVGSPEQYLVQTNLVKTQGTFASAPGELKALAVTAPLTLGDDGSTLTLAGALSPNYGSVLGGITLSWTNTDRLIFQPPLAAVASGTDTMVSVAIPAQTNPFYGSVVGGVTLAWGTTDRLIFQSPLAAVVSGTDTLVSFNSSNYYTKTEVDALIQSVGGAAYSWPSGQVYTFTAASGSMNNFDTSLSTVAGIVLPIQPSTTAHTITFESNEGAPTGASEYLLSIQTGSGRAYSLNVYSGQHSFFAQTGVNWSATYGGVWTRFTFVFDGSAKVYVNSTLKGTIAASNITATFQSVFIGGYSGASPSFTGQMRNFALYQRAFSASEVAAL